MAEEEMISDIIGDSEVSVRQTILIDDLQIQLTKTQLQCVEERRNYLALVGQHEQLKLENEEWKRKFHAALLLGKVQEDAVLYFLQKNPKASEITDEIIRVKEELKKCEGGQISKAQQLDNPVVLMKQVDLLERHLNKTKKQYAAELFSVKTTLELCLEERDIMKEQYECKLTDLLKKLEECKSLVQKIAEDNLRLKKNYLVLEEQKVRELNKLKEQLAEVVGSSMGVGDTSGEGDKTEARSPRLPRKKRLPKIVAPLHSHMMEKISRAELQLMEKENIIKEYEIKFLQMERKMKRAKDEESVTKSICSEMIRRLKTKNEALERRFIKLDERRKLDNVGFRNDVKLLRQLIKAIESKFRLFVYRQMSQKEEEICQHARVEDGKILSPIDKPTSKPPTPPVQDRPRQIPPCENITTAPRGKHKRVPLQNKNLNVVEEEELEKQKVEELNGENEKERRSPLEELERDKLIYELLYKLLESAKGQVDQIEKKVAQQL